MRQPEVPISCRRIRNRLLPLGRPVDAPRSPNVRPLELMHHEIVLAHGLLDHLPLHVVLQHLFAGSGYLLEGRWDRLQLRRLLRLIRFRLSRALNRRLGEHLLRQLQRFVSSEKLLDPALFCRLVLLLSGTH